MSWTSFRTRFARAVLDKATGPAAATPATSSEGTAAKGGKTPTDKARAALAKKKKEQKKKAAADALAALGNASKQ